MSATAPEKLRQTRTAWMRFVVLVLVVTIAVGLLASLLAPGRDDYPRFADGNPFEQDIRSAPVAATSPQMVQDLVRQIETRYAGTANINHNEFTGNVFTATPDTARVRVGFDNCQNRPRPPWDLYQGERYFVDVPIPDHAVPANGTDRSLSIYLPETDQLWEFWKARRDGSGEWFACWGGRIDDVGSSNGQYRYPFGVQASGLAMVGSLLRVQEARAGRIDHAISLTLFSPARGRHSWPANRHDGHGTAPHSIPEGTRLRLSGDVDVESLDMPPVGKAIARAAQQYGFIVVDQAGAVAVVAESGEAERQRTGVDPWPELFAGVPGYRQLENFPWDKIEVIEHDWGKPADAP